MDHTSELVTEKSEIRISKQIIHGQLATHACVPKHALRCAGTNHKNYEALSSPLTGED
jgi:hypothetical protein